MRQLILFFAEGFIFLILLIGAAASKASDSWIPIFIAAMSTIPFAVLVGCLHCLIEIADNTKELVRLKKEERSQPPKPQLTPQRQEISKAEKWVQALR